MSHSSTVAVSIGNSDNKLGQFGWSRFFSDVDDLVQAMSVHVFGVYLSEPSSQYQNACWLFEIGVQNRDEVRRALRKLARTYKQDSIAWLEGQSELLEASTAEDSE